MPDNFNIFIPGEIRRKIALWQLSAELLTRIDDQLQSRLSPDPSNHLVRVKDIDGSVMYLFSFSEPEPANADQTHLFQFRFIYGPGETALIIIDCGHILVNRNPPPGPDDNPPEVVD